MDNSSPLNSCQYASHLGQIQRVKHNAMRVCISMTWPVNRVRNKLTRRRYKFTNLMFLPERSPRRMGRSCALIKHLPVDTNLLPFPLVFTSLVSTKVHVICGICGLTPTFAVIKLLAHVPSVEGTWEINFAKTPDLSLANITSSKLH